MPLYRSFSSCLLAWTLLALLLSIVASSRISVSYQPQIRVTYWRCYAATDCCFDIQRALEIEPIEAIDFGLQACYKNIARVPENPNQIVRAPSHLLVTTVKNHTRSWLPPPDEQFSHLDWINYYWNSTNWMQAPDDDANKAGARVLKSWWSGDRGMHKSFYQRVQMNGFSRASLLFYLPRSMFINVEDAFNVDSTEISLIHADVIDEEQPSFASPAHAVWIELKNGNDSIIEYALKVHTRYPEPDGDFQKITMLAPVVVSERKENDNQSFDLLSTWVASGSKDDLGTVLLVSIGVAIMGAVVMLKDMSQVGKQ